MVEPTTVAAMALPSDADIARAEAFTREPFVHPGEEPASALAPGTPRRRALDQALIELDAGLKVPSPGWRREFSLLLGLERVLSEDEPKLADGTTLSAHQVDALSGTLTALLAEASTGLGANGAVDVLAGAAILGVEDEEPDGAEGASSRSPTSTRRTTTRRSPRSTRTTTTTRTSTALPPRRRTTRRRRTSPRSSRPSSIAPRPRRRSRTGTRRRTPRAPRTTSSSPSSPRIPTPPSASGSSTRPAPARRSPRSASSRPRAPAAC